MDDILRLILKLDGALLYSADNLFKWIIVPSHMTAVMDNPTVYTMWRFVRDFFNTTLIMILLFSAFATIFQASTNYNYKKVLINLIIMALLVNFSYPIARFIIDMSNIFMYGFLNQLGGDGSFWNIVEKSGILGIINGAEGKTADSYFLLAAVIFTFMFAITMLTIAVLLVIRTIALTIFIIFSPIAFLGSTLPGTDLANAASGWWKEFMKYCFAGPIMIFMLVLANRMMIAVADSAGGLKLSADGGTLSSSVSSISFFVLPLVILWIGIERAQSSGIAGASMVVGQGTKMMKWVGNAPHRTAWWAAKKTGVPGGIQQKWTNWKKSGLLGSDRQAEREARIAGSGPFAVPNVIDQTQLKRIKETKERLNIDNTSEADLRRIAANGTQYERAAAIQRLAELGATTQNDLNNVRAAFGETSQVFMQLVNKVKTYDPVAAFSHITDPARWQEMMQSHMRSNQFDAKKLSANTLGNTNFMQMAFQEQAISNKDLEDLRGKSVAHGNNIDASLAAIAGNFANLNAADPNLSPEQLRINRNVQMAHFAQIGGFHGSITGDQDSRTQIISRLDKDTAKRMSTNTITNYADDIANNIRTNRYKNIVLNMDDEAAQRELNHQMQNTQQNSPTAQNISRLAGRDHDLMHIHN